MPGNDAELAAEFRRHGAKPGQRLRIAVVDRNGWATAAEQTLDLDQIFTSFQS